MELYLASFNQHNKIIIWYAILIQSLSGILLITTPFSLQVARLGIPYQIFHNQFLIGVLECMAAGLALIGLNVKARYKFLQLLYFIPQQFFLILTAGSAINYIILQHYADGILRPWQFILLDQLPTLILVVLYFIPIYNIGKNND